MSTDIYSSRKHRRTHPVRDLITTIIAVCMLLGMYHQFKLGHYKGDIIRDPNCPWQKNSKLPIWRDVNTNTK